jgi:hypothetical protein
LGQVGVLSWVKLFEHTTAAGVGVVGIRVLAGGALSGSTERHPIASPPPEPIGSAVSYERAATHSAIRQMPCSRCQSVRSSAGGRGPAGSRISN